MVAYLEKKYKYVFHASEQTWRTLSGKYFVFYYNLGKDVSYSKPSTLLYQTELCFLDSFLFDGWDPLWLLSKSLKYLLIET